MALLALMASGCAADRNHVEKNLMGDRDRQRNDGVVEHYLVGFPDVLEIEVAEHHEFSGKATVGADGRVFLRNGQNIRAEGHTVSEIARALAELTGVPATSIRVRVAEHHSQQLFLMGEVVGWQRNVPYQGQETVLDVLQRVGGITPGAAPDDVYVVRSHLVDGQRPEVFHVDLDAIVMKRDAGTNIRVMPFDQIHVGESREARFIKCFPRWFRPLCHALCGTRRSTKDGKGISRRGEARSHPTAPPAAPGLPNIPAEPVPVEATPSPDRRLPELSGSHPCHKMPLP
jgi:protein involved in polysaccharide export with SLBB domain